MISKLGNKEQVLKKSTVLVNSESQIMPKDDKLQRLVFITDPKKAQ